MTGGRTKSLRCSWEEQWGVAKETSGRGGNRQTIYVAIVGIQKHRGLEQCPYKGMNQPVRSVPKFAAAASLTLYN